MTNSRWALGMLLLVLVVACRETIINGLIPPSVGVIRGLVLNERDEPQPNVRVIASNLRSNCSNPVPLTTRAMATTDNDGQFHIVIVLASSSRPHCVDLIAEAQGDTLRDVSVAMSSPGELPSDTTVVTMVLSP